MVSLWRKTALEEICQHQALLVMQAIGELHHTGVTFYICLKNKYDVYVTSECVCACMCMFL